MTERQELFTKFAMTEQCCSKGLNAIGDSHLIGWSESLNLPQENVDVEIPTPLPQKGTNTWADGASFEICHEQRGCEYPLLKIERSACQEIHLGPTRQERRSTGKGKDAWAAKAGREMSRNALSWLRNQP